MALTSLAYSPPVRRRVRPPNLDFALLETAAELDEQGKHAESVVKVFEHLFPKKSVPDLTAETFTFVQGSSLVSARINGDEVVITVPLVRLPTGGQSIAALRYILTKVSGTGQIFEPRLRGDDVHLEFKDKLTRTHPAKIREVLQRMPFVADGNDDYLIGQFNALPLERAAIQPVSDDEFQRCDAIWRSHWNEIEELASESQKKRSSFFLNEVTAYAVYHLSAVIPLHGFLAARLSEASHVFSDGDNDPMKREAALAKAIKDMKAISPEELRKYLGHVEYSICPISEGTPAVLSNYFESGNYIETIDKMRKSGQSMDAALALISSYNFLLARYAWAENVEARLEEGLALTGGKSWREVASALFDHAKAIADELGANAEEEEEEEEAP